MIGGGGGHIWVRGGGKCRHDWQGWGGIYGSGEEGNADIIGRGGGAHMGGHIWVEHIWVEHIWVEHIWVE